MSSWSKKSIVLIGVLAIVLVGGLGVGGYFLFRKSPRTSTLTSSSARSQTLQTLQSDLDALRSSVQALSKVDTRVFRRYRFKLHFPDTETSKPRFPTTWTNRNLSTNPFTTADFKNAFNVFLDVTDLSWPGWFRVDIFLNIQCPDVNSDNGGSCVYSWSRKAGSGSVKVVDNQSPTGWVAFANGPTTKVVSSSQIQAILPWAYESKSKCYFNGYVEIYGQGDLGGAELETGENASPRLVDISATLIDGTLPTGVTSTQKVIAEF